jgi:2,3-bisphosphoglycerate-independent phosphoglycerate mutase
MKKIFIVLDGAADLPTPALNGKTPLEAAEMPNLDYLANNGKTGYMYSIDEKVIPESDTAIISILGNDYRLCRRGLYEAIGAGIKLKRGDLAVRTNFCTIDNLKNKTVIDRRAGRNLTTRESKELTKAINQKLKLPCKFEFISTVQHRGVLILRGGFSDNITNIDSEWSSGSAKKFKFSEPMDDDELSKYTADIINEFVDQSFKILSNHPINLERIKKGLLPANMIFLRGPGMEVPQINKYPNWMSINSMPLEKGVAIASEMENFSFEMPELEDIDVYKNLYDSLNKSIEFAIKTIKEQYKNYDGCYIQLKETDLAGHDNKADEKKKMLEIIDKDFFSFLKDFVLENKIKLVVTCDHATPCILKKHSADPVPVLFYDGKNKDSTTAFSEKESKKGSLGKIYGRELFKKVGFDK